MTSQPFDLESDALPLRSAPRCRVTQAFSYARRARTVSRAHRLVLFTCHTLRRLCYRLPVCFMCSSPLSISCRIRSSLSSLIISLIITQHLSSSLISYISLSLVHPSRFLIYLPLCLCPCLSLTLALSHLLRGCSVSLLVIRSDALALLRGVTLFTGGLCQIGMRESMAAGLGSAVVSVSVNEVRCIHAAPRKCNRSLQLAHSVCVC